MIDFTRLLIKDEELRYRYDERLSLMVEDKDATQEQKDLALKWAKESM